MDGRYKRRSCHELLSPRDVALVLMALGTGGLVVATIDYHRQTAALHERSATTVPSTARRQPAWRRSCRVSAILGFVLVFLRQ